MASGFATDAAETDTERNIFRFLPEKTADTIRRHYERHPYGCAKGEIPQVSHFF